MSTISLFQAHLNYVDGIAIAIMGLSILLGFMRGFTREVLGLLGWSGALFVTIWGQHYLQGPLRHLIGNPLFADLITLVVLFISSLFILLTISRSLSRQIRASVLGGLDRSLGVLFGLGRGLVVCVGIFIAVNHIFKPYKRPPAIIMARGYPLIVYATGLAARFLPEGLIPPAFYHPYPTKQGPLPEIPERTSEDLMEVLSQPKASHQESEKEEDSGYGTGSRQDIERLFKNYSKGDR